MDIADYVLDKIIGNMFRRIAGGYKYDFRLVVYIITGIANHRAPGGRVNNSEYF